MANLRPDRRQLLAGSMTLAATPAAAAAAAAAPPSAFQPRPLPFDPRTIVGLSEKLLLSHHQNNYGGAVRRLSQIVTQVATLDPATAAGFQLNGLKREELIAWNSMILHEIYFDSLGPAAAPSVGLAQAIERDFGSDARWRAEFSAMGRALGGGSGWVILTWSQRDNRLVNQWAADHTMTLAAGVPLLALDMYEHAYHIDYGANAAAYVDAFMKAASWTKANETFRRLAA